MIRKQFASRIAVTVACAAGAVLLATAPSAKAADAVSFKGKTVTILVGSAPGGSSDLSARLFIPYLTKYLPGSPATIVQNMPGAHNVIAMNWFAQQAKRDGLTVITASGSEVDPLNYRVPQAHYDPNTFEMIGGVNLGGTDMIVRNEALPRLLKKGGAPVTLGSIAGYPHIGMQMSAWGIKYLGWNARWVTGYGNNNDLAIALERGEIDMTALGDDSFVHIPALLDKSKFTIIYQTGTDAGKEPSEVPALHDVPLFAKAMEGKISDPLAKAAYDYWRDLSYLFKWIALPNGTPKPIVDVYREAFKKTVADPAFVAASEKLTPGFTAIPVEELVATVHDVADVRTDALGFMTQMLREQGLNVEALKHSKHDHKHEKNKTKG
jgi:hypothetical protein